MAKGVCSSVRTVGMKKTNGLDNAQCVKNGIHL